MSLFASASATSNPTGPAPATITRSRASISSPRPKRPGEHSSKDTMASPRHSRKVNPVTAILCRRANRLDAGRERDGGNGRRDRQPSHRAEVRELAGGGGGDDRGGDK